MPTPQVDGTWSKSRLATGPAGRWLTALLAKLDPGVVPPKPYGTHSCKATLLSWCAKAGLHHSVRRLLGAHVTQGDRSLLEYSRDALAEPLRLLGEVLSKVRAGRCLPDQTRSGRWPEEDDTGSGPPIPEGASPAKPLVAEGVPDELGEAGDDDDASLIDLSLVCASCCGEVTAPEPLRCGFCAEPVHDTPRCRSECDSCDAHLCNGCRPPEVHDCGGPEQSSEASLPSENSDASVEEALEAFQQDRPEEEAEREPPAPGAPGPLWRDLREHELHVEVGEGRSLCGRAVGPPWRRLVAAPWKRTLRCGMCFPSVGLGAPGDEVSDP